MKTFYKILLVFVLSVGVMVVLYFMQEKPMRNGFKRGQVYAAKKLDSMELKSNYWHINRLSDNRIYLGNYKALLVMFSCGYDLQDSVYERLFAIDKRKSVLELLKKQVLQKIDTAGIRFNADGYLSYSEPLERIIYAYYYRNQFVCLDTGLRVLYTAQMIDTNTVAKIRLGAYEANGKKIQTMAKPGLMVNKRGCADGSWFYNHAALAADNERLDVFNAHEVLDVYQLNDGRYSHSIYLPKHPGRKLTDFGVQANRLVALYENVLVVYRL